MAEENNNNAPELTPVQQIVQHAIAKEPSQLKGLVHKEIASRVMSAIQTKRAEVGKKLFGN